MSDTVVFIPAWNEEENLPAVLDGLHERLPDADVLVVDDGSTDRTADVAREHGAEVLSLGVNQGLRVGIAAGYRWALEHGYAFCGRVDADGQHPPEELARLLALRARATAATSPSARASSRANGYAAYRYRPSARAPSRHGSAAPLDGARALRRPFGDATSGLYAVNAKALPLLARAVHQRRARGRGADPRSSDAGLRLEEVPVNMADARRRRVEAARRQGGQARAHGRGDAGPRSPCAEVSERRVSDASTRSRRAARSSK